MDITPPLFIGFRVKTVPPAGDLLNGNVAGLKTGEICSISECLTKAPPNWEQRWDFNRASCYNSEAVALATVPADEADHYALFAYRMFFIEFGKDNYKPLPLPDALNSGLEEIAPEPDLSAYCSIGYDIAGGPVGNWIGFSCSPLSCNCMSSQYPVNRFWLVDDLARAVRVAEDFGRIEPEPGPFYLYEVLRKRSSGWQPT